MEEFYKVIQITLYLLLLQDDPSKVLDPSLSTLGNPANTYTR